MLAGCMREDLRFKRVWDGLAGRKSSEEIVFGPCLAHKYSRRQDSVYFASLEKVLNIRPSDVVLDIGCGPLARAENYFSQKDFGIVGVDVSFGILKKARDSVRKYGSEEQVGLVLGDAEFLPFRGDSFRVILCIGLISHLPSRLSVVNSLREIRHCLTEDGICYVDWLQNLYSLLGLQQELIYKVPDSSNASRVQLLHFRGLKEVRSLFKQAELKISKIFFGPLIQALTPFYHLFPTFVKNAVDKLASIMDRLHEKYPILASFAYSFDVVTEKY